MANIVLVAGGWHGGWYYASIARQLRARGNEVFTPTLTGLGERIHLSGACPNLDTHIEDIANVIRFEDLNNVILCGHTRVWLSAASPIGFQNVFPPSSTWMPSCQKMVIPGGILPEITTVSLH